MVRRFDNDEGASEMYECDDGAYVTYQEYIESLDKLNFEIAALKEFAQMELSRGAAYGKNVGYNIGYEKRSSELE